VLLITQLTGLSFIARRSRNQNTSPSFQLSAVSNQL
jgi:hypothetical protein